MALTYSDFLGVEFNRNPLRQVIGFERPPYCEDGLGEYAANPARQYSYHKHKRGFHQENTTLIHQGHTTLIHQGHTTLMIRNVHHRYKAKELLQELCVRGFAGCFDFFYLPMDFGTAKSRGYAFINFLSFRDARRFYNEFHGKSMLLFNKVGKLVEIAPSFTQGLHANLCWYLERHSCRVLNSWFQPLLVLQSVGKTIAYPLYENCMSLVNGGEIDTNSVSEMAAEIILKLKGPETELDTLYPDMIFNL